MCGAEPLSSCVEPLPVQDAAPTPTITMARMGKRSFPKFLSLIDTMAPSPGLFAFVSHRVKVRRDLSRIGRIVIGVCLTCPYISGHGRHLGLGHADATLNLGRLRAYAPHLGLAHAGAGNLGRLRAHGRQLGLRYVRVRLLLGWVGPSAFCLLPQSGRLISPRLRTAQR